MPLKLDANINLASIAISLGLNAHNLSAVGLSNASLVWITPLGTIDFTGMTGGEEGRMMFLGLRNSAAYSVNILAENAGSLEANRFASAVVMNASGTGAIITAWVYFGSRWRRWK